jgi:hypothetical protein
VDSENKLPSSGSKNKPGKQPVHSSGPTAATPLLLLLVLTGLLYRPISEPRFLRAVPCACCLLGLLFNSEDGGIRFSETSMNYRTKRRHITEDGTSHLPFDCYRLNVLSRVK